MTVLEALRMAGVDARDVRILLAAATGFSEVSVVAFPEKQLTPEAESRFLEYLGRRKEGEPVAYILGRREFYDLDLVVSPAVLIPRPETELLVDLALAGRPSSVLDLGTGSGAIALAIKKHRPSVRVVAVEASAAALVVARRNAEKYNLQVEFRHGRWFEPVEGERFDLIVANPPYVAVGDSHLADLRFEPAEALVAGADGLDAIRAIVPQVAAHLNSPGWLYLEHGIGQDAAVRELLKGAGLEGVVTWPDLAGIARVTGGKR